MILSQRGSELLAGAESILFVGAGGGYDVFGAVPLVAGLLAEGKRVHMAGVTFTSVSALPGATAHPELPQLFPITAAQAVTDRYCPEAWLATWLQRKYGYTEPVWALKKCGVRLVVAAYANLVRSLGVDAIVLIDGGVDVLLKGNETSIGTPVEDLCSLAALDQIAVPVRLVACLGFGTELREGVRHAQVLERIAELVRAGAFRGTAGLSRDTTAGAAYVDALEFAFANQVGQNLSHVHSVVLSALRGDFGGSEPDIWVSPLASLFWFFDLAGVALSHIFLPRLLDTESIFEATAIVRGCRKAIPARPSTDIPL